MASGFRVEIHGLKAVQDTVGKLPLDSALKKVFNNTVVALHHDIRKAIKQYYACPRDAADVAIIKYVTAKSPEASISYKYKKIELAKYPTKQIRLTTFSRKLFVERKNFRAPFHRQIIESDTTYTEVMVKRSGGYKIVEGTARYGYRKGWLHTGRKKAFAAQIFERDQKSTWAGGKRLPFHRLYGPSVSQLVMSPIVQKAIEESPYMKNITEFLLRELANAGN